MAPWESSIAAARPRTNGSATTPAATIGRADCARRGARQPRSGTQRAFNALTAQIDTAIKHAQLAPQNLTHSRHVAFVKQG
jgi:hypothetical protein